jgi:hypothetical protein
LSLAQKAKEVQPNLINASDTLGWIAYKKGLYSEALPLLQECVARVPESAVYRYHLGMTLVASGDKQRGRETLESALRLKLAGEDAERVRDAIKSLSR